MARRTRTGNEKKLTVEVDPELLRDFHIYAKKQGKPLRAIVESWIRETLELAGAYCNEAHYKPSVEYLLAEGKHTRKEIAEIVCSKVPGINKDTLLQYLTDIKKADKAMKQFGKRVVEIDRRKCLGFAELLEGNAGDQSGHGNIENDEQTGEPR